MSKAENAYRTIAEVSDLLEVQPSVLRFWETQFHQIKPTKRMGRRYYSAEDVVLLGRIRDLLYKEGFTIKGVQKKLREKEEPLLDLTVPESPQAQVPVPDSLIRELTDLRDSLKKYID